VQFPLLMGSKGQGPGGMAVLAEVGSTGLRFCSSSAATAEEVEPSFAVARRNSRVVLLKLLISHY